MRPGWRERANRSEPTCGGGALRCCGSRSITSRASARDGAWKTEEAWLALGEGLGFRAGLDPYASALVTRLDGSRPLRDALADAAAATGSDLAVFTPPALEVTRSLLGLGFAVPAP